MLSLASKMVERTEVSKICSCSVQHGCPEHRHRQEPCALLSSMPTVGTDIVVARPPYIYALCAPVEHGVFAAAESTQDVGSNSACLMPLQYGAMRIFQTRIDTRTLDAGGFCAKDRGRVLMTHNSVVSCFRKFTVHSKYGCSQGGYRQCRNAQLKSTKPTILDDHSRRVIRPTSPHA